jgi:SAM-dependent methyltransferase
MDRHSTERLVALYRRSLELHGPTVKGVRWANDAVQRERFRLLDRIGLRTGRSIADVGCGLGDLLAFLRGRRWRGLYDGFDIVPEMLAAARRKQAGRRGRFSVRDVQNEGFPHRYDYVVASGTFNLRIEDHEAFFRRMIEAMYAACRRGVAFNVLRPVPRANDRERAYDVFFRNSYFVASHEDLLAVCRPLSPHVEILEWDGLEHDTTVLLRRPA